MVIRYKQDYTLSKCREVAKAGTGIPHFVDNDMRPYRLVNHYLCSHVKRWSAHTVRTVSENLFDFLLWMEVSGLTLETIKLRHVELYMNALAGGGNRALSLSTVVQRVGHACRFFDWAKRIANEPILWDGEVDAERGMIRETRHHFTKATAKQITPKLLRQNTRFLHLPDAIRFIESFQISAGEDYKELASRNQLMAKIMLQCGLRVEEVVTIPAGWVSEIVANQRRAMQLGRVRGKGDKVRPIEWPTQLLLEVQEYIDFQRQHTVETAQSVDRKYKEPLTLFLAEDGTSITTNWVNKLFRRNSKACGIHCTPHMLRHTYGTYHYLIHRDLAKLANLMGHASEETTRTYYVHTAALISMAGYFDDFQREIDTKLGITQG